MRSALEAPYSQPRERQSVFRFNWPVTEEGKSVTIRIISAYPAVYRFWYPSFNTEENRQVNAVFNLSAGLQNVDGFLYEYPNSSANRSQAEQNFIALHNEILKLRKTDCGRSWKPEGSERRKLKIGLRNIVCSNGLMPSSLGQDQRFMDVRRSSAAKSGLLS